MRLKSNDENDRKKHIQVAILQRPKQRAQKWAVQRTRT